MRGISTEKVCFIVVKARESNAKEPAAEESGSNPTDDKMKSLEDRDDATRAELRAFIDALNVDEKVRIVALMWTGRGDFDPSEWNEAVAQAAEHNQRTADYLLGTPLLADYLERGLDCFGESCLEFEAGRL
jgi:hypothetical protein